VVRLGSRRAIALDARLVAATNVDLAEAVRAQHFRADLFYRLSVATVSLPPLRERQGDILPLVDHFVAFYGAKLGLDNIALAREAREAILNYPWPGNIRELENAVHHALIVCRDSLIQASDLRLPPSLTMPRGTWDNSSKEAAGECAGECAGEYAGEDPDEDALHRLHAVFLDCAQRGLPDLFRRVEGELVRAAFASAKENQVRAAKVLGITRNSMRTLLKRHQLLSSETTQSAHLPRAAAVVQDGLAAELAEAGTSAKHREQIVVA
jgi:sigma-54-specific transcriptional regulator